MSHKRKAPWDRNTKYWCRYCSIFVHDNSSSRRIHESGVKHKENMQQYLRNIDENAEKAASAEAALQKQLDKIEQAASDAYSKDTGSNPAAAASQPGTEPPPTKTTAVAAPSEPAEEPEELAMDSRPADIGVVGGWEVVEGDDEEEKESGGGTESFHPAADGGVGTAIADESATSDAALHKLHKLRGSEWLDDEDVAKAEEFEVAEKTLHSADSNGARADDKGAAAGASGMFKKRRIGSRNTRKK
ncbi:WW domain binding protein 4 [Linderina macrospora]|uniref:WW domain binding protein 4 n=1 Tax=Linderina macrospora TaxID=4868 RepID=A0ACC1J669_9FUNG|nr:WW domain binding protein 4 [Linderina macrospora]